MVASKKRLTLQKEEEEQLTAKAIQPALAPDLAAIEYKLAVLNTAETMQSGDALYASFPN